MICFIPLFHISFLSHTSLFTLFIWVGKFSVMGRLFLYLWSIGNSIPLFEWKLAFHLSHKFRWNVKINVKTDVVWLVMNHNLWHETMFLFAFLTEDVGKRGKWCLLRKCWLFLVLYVCAIFKWKRWHVCEMCFCFAVLSLKLIGLTGIL